MNVEEQEAKRAAREAKAAEKRARDEERARNKEMVAAERERVKREKSEAREAARLEKLRQSEEAKAAREQERAQAAAVREAEREARKNDPAASNASVVDQKRYQYNANGARTSSGRRAVDCNDVIAKALRGKSADEVVQLVPLNGAEINPAWATLNPGLKRMSASNVLRRQFKLSGKLTLADGSHVDENTEFPEVVVTNAPVPASVEEAE